MAQDLTVNIKTTSDVPQAMEKAKAATVSFSKQVDDIKKKFSTAFKDIFLGFTAPMVIIQSVVGFIRDQIEESKRLAQEGMDLIAKGETKLATAEETKLGAFLKALEASERERKSYEKGMSEFMRTFSTTETGRVAMEKFLSEGANRFLVQGGMGQPNYEAVFANKEFQKRMVDAFINSPEGKKFAYIFDEKKASENAPKPGTFKGPEGFGSVIGVGANPVMEAMTKQVEVLQEIKLILQESMPSGGGVPPSFTEPLNAASRVGNV
jgi:exonuclease VII small subunit